LAHPPILKAETDKGGQGRTSCASQNAVMV